MKGLFLKYIFASFSFLAISNKNNHPIFMSVTEIEHNAKTKSLEISCKVFTDDFEKHLRTIYRTKIDLLDLKTHETMNKFVNEYIQKHLQIVVDGKQVSMKFLGYEQIEEGIYSYFEVQNITAVKTLNITDNILYDYKSEQISLIHATVNAVRKSTKITNPESKVAITF
jgi:hypothetical protein